MTTILEIHLAMGELVRRARKSVEEHYETGEVLEDIYVRRGVYTQCVKMIEMGLEEHFLKWLISECERPLN